jgi:hypothetical protein
VLRQRVVAIPAALHHADAFGGGVGLAVDERVVVTVAAEVVEEVGDGDRLAVVEQLEVDVAQAGGEPHLRVLRRVAEVLAQVNRLRGPAGAVGGGGLADDGDVKELTRLERLDGDGHGRTAAATSVRSLAVLHRRGHELSVCGSGPFPLRQQ